MIKRHSKSAIFMHWSNAVCWLFLLFSGFAILENPLMQPVSASWTELWNGVFGGAFNVLNAHVIVGLIWIILYACYLLFKLKSEALPFMQEVMHIEPKSDTIWCIRKGMRLTVGEKIMRKMGMETQLPPQGFYNAGQKFAAIAAVFCSIGLALTGLVMFLMGGSDGQCLSILPVPALWLLCSLFIFIWLHWLRVKVLPCAPCLQDLCPKLLPKCIIRFGITS